MPLFRSLRPPLPTPRRRLTDHDPASALRDPRGLGCPRLPLRGRGDLRCTAAADRPTLRRQTLCLQLGAQPREDQPGGFIGPSRGNAPRVELLRSPPHVEPHQAAGRAVVASVLQGGLRFGNRRRSGGGSQLVGLRTRPSRWPARRISALQEPPPRSRPGSFHYWGDAPCSRPPTPGPAGHWPTPVKGKHPPTATSAGQEAGTNPLDDSGRAWRSTVRLHPGHRRPAATHAHSTEWALRCRPWHRAGVGGHCP